jgi:glyoxylase-like metal-dependent hydrolase (beta-lactamase superfamily II)
VRPEFTTEPQPAPVAVTDDVLRLTLPLPIGIDHVNCYFLRASDGSWTLVDTGLGLGDAEELWAPVLAQLDAPVGRIVVTHFHPDHLGGATGVADLTGAKVVQGRLDRRRSEEVWDRARDGTFDAYLRSHGAPDELLGGRGSAMRLPPDPELLDEGDELDGWRVLVLPGHADAHIVLERDGVLVAGDTILGGITPHVGLYPGGLDDPLADFGRSLARIEALAPALTLPGHGPVLTDAAARAREIAAHHDERLDTTAAALAADPQTAWQVSRTVFEHAPSSQFRFALTETLAHLERLVRLGRAERFEGHPVRFAT